MSLFSKLADKINERKLVRAIVEGLKVGTALALGGATLVSCGADVPPAIVETSSDVGSQDNFSADTEIKEEIKEDEVYQSQYDVVNGKISEFKKQVSSLEFDYIKGAGTLEQLRKDLEKAKSNSIISDENKAIYDSLKLTLDTLGQEICKIALQKSYSTFMKEDFVLIVCKDDKSEKTSAINTREDRYVMYSGDIITMGKDNYYQQCKSDYTNFKEGTLSIKEVNAGKIYDSILADITKAPSSSIENGILTYKIVVDATRTCSFTMDGSGKIESFKIVTKDLKTGKETVVSSEFILTTEHSFKMSFDIASKILNEAMLFSYPENQLPR